MRHPKKTRYGDYATWVAFEVLANYAVRVIFTSDLHKSAKSRLNTLPEDADAFCFHVSGKGMSYMFLPLDASESTIAHEAWHVVYKIMHYIGVQDLDNEIVAYHLDHLIEKIYKFKNSIQEVRDDQSNSRPSSKKRSA